MKIKTSHCFIFSIGLADEKIFTRCRQNMFHRRAFFSASKISGTRRTFRAKLFQRTTKNSVTTTDTKLLPHSNRPSGRLPSLDSNLKNNTPEFEEQFASPALSAVGHRLLIPLVVDFFKKNTLKGRWYRGCQDLVRATGGEDAMGCAQFAFKP